MALRSCQQSRAIFPTNAKLVWLQMFFEVHYERLQILHIKFLCWCWILIILQPEMANSFILLCHYNLLYPLHVSCSYSVTVVALLCEYIVNETSKQFLLSLCFIHFSLQWENKRRGKQSLLKKNWIFQPKYTLIGENMLHLLPHLELCTGNEHSC